MRVCNLSSGSDGNCTLIETDQTKVLIDAGLSSSIIVSRLEKLGVKPNQIEAIIISHDHFDHTKGINVFAGKYKTKIYAHVKTWHQLETRFTRIENRQKHIFYDSDFQIKDLKIETIEVSHDAVYTCAFKLSSNSKVVCIATDLGEIPINVLNFLEKATLTYIEANHDPKLLAQNANYSYALKKRILSKHGHLSNEQCAKAIEHLALCGTTQFVLSHLSKENNSPLLAYTTISNYLAEKDIIEGKHIKIDVATTEIGTVFRL